jgi:hypothetical protein
MEENKVLIGALIFIGLVVGANFVMYAIARGAARSGGRGLLETLAKSLNTNPSKKKDEMEELRRSVQELTKSGDEADQNPG